MISIWAVLAIVFFHWFADFVCQSDWQAKNKSTNNSALLQHTAMYAALWAIPGFLGALLGLINPIMMLQFILVTFVFHTITDYFTSRLNTWLWKKGDVHNFFVSVGFDQFLHYAQLLITFMILWK
jgi:hypothetical protein